MVSRFNPPSWAEVLKYKPSCILNKLAMKPTPIEKWSLPQVPDQFKLYIKRDDLTGGLTMGNKIRKLEFLLADALSQGCTDVITTGSINSNHCRATCIAAKRLGMQSHLFLESDNYQNLNDFYNPTWNVQQNCIVGAKMYLVPKIASYEDEVLHKMQKLARKLEQDSLTSETTRKCCIIPVGGSSIIGIFGYINAFQEMIEQNILENFDDLVVTVSSGATCWGLAIANYLSGSKLRIHAISVSYNSDLVYKLFAKILHEQELCNCSRKEDSEKSSLPFSHLNCADLAVKLMHVADDYVGGGYAIHSEELLNFISDVAQHSGIIAEPVYTGKSIFGMVDLLRNHPTCFQGNRVLYIFTGGSPTAKGLGDWLSLDACNAKNLVTVNA